MRRHARAQVPKKRKKETKHSVRVLISTPMLHFLELEAKSLSEKKSKPVGVSDVLRALITAYFEKRMANLILSPDD